MRKRTAVAGIAVVAAGTLVRWAVAQRRSPRLTASEVGQRVRDQIAAGEFGAAVERANGASGGGPAPRRFLPSLSEPGSSLLENL
jgi:hypothetical protein